MKRATAKRFCESLDDVRQLCAGMEQLITRFQPGEYRVTLEHIERDRTTLQNCFYWAMLNDIAEQTGNDVDDLHLHFRARFLQDRTVKPARIKSTTELTVSEFVRYIDQILSYVGSEFGISVQLSREF